MAQPVYLNLVISGEEVFGESPVTTLEREHSIECSSFELAIAAGVDTSRTGRTRGPVRIKKRIDRSTAILIRALCRNEEVKTAEFRFFRPKTDTAAEEEHFYTVLLENARVTSVKQLSEDHLSAGPEAPPMMEEVELMYESISWTYEIGGYSHTDTVR
ncbi:MAG: type VI secretion system tube protein TssD [Myxococcales bacterium]|nr:type VI secretion system tube protein TssD [Myxococcales bacterium]